MAPWQLREWTVSGFDPTVYGPVIAELVRAPRLAPLGPGTPNEAVRAQLEALAGPEAFGAHPVRDRAMADACRAGLWLYHDFLDESHTLSQSIDTTTGSYWHGLMHRREPDYGNAAYWFRRVGNHPIFRPLHDAAVHLAETGAADAAARFLGHQTRWDPFAFIDLCAACAAGQSSSELLCRQIQQREWELLLDYSYRQAVGVSA
jgi:hypothetical protein